MNANDAADAKLATAVSGRGQMPKLVTMRWCWVPAWAACSRPGSWPTPTSR